MAHLWIEASAGEWSILPLSLSAATPVSAAAALGRGRPGAVRLAADAAFITHREEAGRATWLLFARPSSASRVHVNGQPLLPGLRALDDRDEIRVEGGPSVFFSAETLARVVPMPASDQSKTCPRCRQPIASGTSAVSCPNAACGLWHHQSDEFPCWLYSTRCAACEQETALDAGFRWTPEEL